jgi:hypothetical protein
MAYRLNEWTPEEDAKLAELYAANLMPGQIARALGRTVNAVDSRRRKIGLKRHFVPERAPPPEDFVERVKTMNVSQLIEHYGRARTVIFRWMRELQITRVVAGVRKKAIPANFHKMATTMTRAELMRLYNTNHVTVRGWLEELGITPLSMLERRAQMAAPAPIKIEEECTVPRREFKSHTKLIAAEAAQFLRRTHRSVHRADIQMYEQSSHTWGDVNNVRHRGINQYFVSGKGVMWLDDLIAYAETKGFTIKELI